MRFRTDPKVENEGVWFEFEHVRVKLARESENNRAFKEYMAAEFKKVETAIRVKMLSNEKARAILRSAYAHTIVREWETRVDDKWVPGVELLRGDKFEIVPATPENVLKYFDDPGNVDTFNALRESAREAEPYREIRDEIREGEAKN